MREKLLGRNEISNKHGPVIIRQGTPSNYNSSRRIRNCVVTKAADMRLTTRHEVSKDTCDMDLGKKSRRQSGKDEGLDTGGKS